jgi:hypothetical protein
MDERGQSWGRTHSELPGAERSGGSGPAAAKCLELEMEMEQESIWLRRGLARLLRTKASEKFNVAQQEIVAPIRFLPGLSQPNVPTEMRGGRGTFERFRDIFSVQILRVLAVDAFPLVPIIRAFNCPLKQMIAAARFQCVISQTNR